MWTAIQCAMQGRSHIKSDTPCQDKTYSIVANGTQVISLADGAGSARLSHYGAECVTRGICLELIEKFDDYFAENNGVVVKQQFLTQIANNLNEKSTQLECTPKDLSSTLLVVAIKDEHFIIAHIGDGVIGYLKNNELKIASHPENGEFVNTTVFTTSKDAIMTMKLIKGNLGQIKGFILMSDGTEVSLYNKKEQRLADVLKKIMQMSIILPPAKVQNQLQHSFENIVIQATTDDCSIGILVKNQDKFKGYMCLSISQKCELLKINSKAAKKKVERYDDILMYLSEKRSLSQIARHIFLKKKYAKKYVDKLCELNFVEKIGNNYQTILIMDVNGKIL